MNTIYKLGMIAGLALTLGCRQKIKLEGAPPSVTVNSAGELSDVMNGFGTGYSDSSIRQIYLPQHPDLEIRHDVDNDGVQDIAFRAGDIGYHKELPQSIYYAIHSSELSDVAKREYQKEVEKLMRKRKSSNQEGYNIKLNEMKLNFPLKWHKHIPDFDGI